MAGEVQQVYQDVDRFHRRGEEAADARAREMLASLATPLGSEGCDDHAHGDLAVEAEEAASSPVHQQAQLPLRHRERGAFVLTERPSVGHPSDVIIPVM